MRHNNLLNAIFSNLITSRVQKYSPIPNSLVGIIDASIIRLLDSKMIIEDRFSSNLEKKEVRITSTMPLIGSKERFLRLYEEIKLDGLGTHFFELTVELFFVLINLTASEHQANLIKEWGAKGHAGCFLMTDSGGPMLNCWESECFENNDESINLKINKIWAIGAHDFDFAVIGVKDKRKMVPQLFVLSPSDCIRLNKSLIGSAFLDGNMQLGNVVGEINIPRCNQLNSGGLTSAKQYLTHARPRFVLAVMSHVHWLYINKDIALTDEYHEILNFITLVGMSLIDSAQWSNILLDDVLALKFIANEFLLELVVSGSVVNLSDQRDLLALSKMEGSSYRCFYELYTKTRRVPV